MEEGRRIEQCQILKRKTENSPLYKSRLAKSLLFHSGLGMMRSERADTRTLSPSGVKSQRTRVALLCVCGGNRKEENQLFFLRIFPAFLSLFLSFFVSSFFLSFFLSNLFSCRIKNALALSLELLCLSCFLSIHSFLPFSVMFFSRSANATFRAMHCLFVFFLFLASSNALFLSLFPSHLSTIVF